MLRVHASISNMKAVLESTAAITEQNRYGKYTKY